MYTPCTYVYCLIFNSIMYVYILYICNHIQTTASTVKSTPSFQHEVPFEIVGKYLGQLCQEDLIKDHLLFSRNQPSKGKLVSVDKPKHFLC